MNNSWKEYFEYTKNRAPRKLLVRSVEDVRNKGKALDFGASALNDTIFLLDNGFEHVSALDMFPVAQEIADTLPPKRFKYIISRIEEYDLPPETYDLVNAQFSLPFISPLQFEEVFLKLVRSLKKGGVLCGQFFGMRDGWSSNLKMSFHTKENAYKLLSGLEIIYFNEVEEDTPTAGEHIKHWHFFDFVVRK